MENKETKRKTTTSWQVKARYNAKMYASVGVQRPKELVARFKEKCAAEGVSQSQVIRGFIEKYLEE